MKPWEKYQQQDGPWNKYKSQKPKPMFSSEAEGRAASQKVQSNVQTLTQGTQGINPFINALAQSGQRVGQNIGTAGLKTVESAGVMGDTALMGIPGLISQLSTGGKPTGSINPFNLVQGGQNMFRGQDLSGGEKMMAQGAGMVVPVGGAIKTIGEIPIVKSLVKWSKPSNQEKLVGKVKSALAIRKRALVDSYGEEYNKVIGQSDKDINIQKVIENFKNENPEAVSYIRQQKDVAQLMQTGNKKAQQLSSLLDDFSGDETLSKISAKGADELVQFINKLPGIKTKLLKGKGMADFTSEESMLVDLASDIKHELITSHPELSGLKANYAQTMSDLRAIRPNVGKANSLSNFSGWDATASQPFLRQMPKEIIDKVNSFSTSTKLSDLLKKMGLIGITSAGAGAAGRAGVEAYGHVIRH